MRKLLALIMAVLLVASLPLTALAEVIADVSYGNVTIGDTHVDHFDSTGSRSDAHEGSVTVVQGSGTAGGTVTVTAGSESAPADVNITIDNVQDTTVVLDNAHINTQDADGYGGAALDITGGSDVTIELDGDNSLTSGMLDGNFGQAGLQVNEGNSVTIQDAGGTEGSLTATGSDYGAGIGSEDNDWNGVESSGKITITGGTIEANGGKRGAGIGGGYFAGGTDITITGDANVTANGGDYAAGIGGGYVHDGSNIVIGGNAKVTANGGNDAAGIGGGETRDGRDIVIGGNAKVTANGGDDAAGIGGGVYGNGSGIEVKENAEVKTQGQDDSADIGNGDSVDGIKQENTVNTDNLYTTGSITYRDGTVVQGTVTPPVEEDPENPPAEDDPVTPPAEDDPVTPPAENDPVTPPADESASSAGQSAAKSLFKVRDGKGKQPDWSQERKDGVLTITAEEDHLVFTIKLSGLKQLRKQSIHTIVVKSAACETSLDVAKLIEMDGREYVLTQEGKTATLTVDGKTAEI